MKSLAGLLTDTTRLCVWHFDLASANISILTTHRQLILSQLVHKPTALSKWHLCVDNAVLLVSYLIHAIFFSFQDLGFYGSVLLRHLLNINLLGCLLAPLSFFLLLRKFSDQLFSFFL